MGLTEIGMVGVDVEPALDGLIESELAVEVEADVVEMEAVVVEEVRFPTELVVDSLVVVIEAVVFAFRVVVVFVCSVTFVVD